VAVSSLALSEFILPEPTLTIAVHQGVEGVPMKLVARQFCQQAYRGRVKIVELGYDELFAAEWSAVTGNEAPYPFMAPPRFDVIMVDDPWLPAFVGMGGDLSYVQPLDEKRFADPSEVADFPDSCLSVCRSKDVYYAMPFTGNSQLLCRRSDMQQPVSWEAVAKLPIDNDKLAYAMRLGPGNAVVTDFLPILWAYAPDSFKDDYVTLDPKKATQAFRMFHGLAQKQHWASAVTQDVDVAVSLALQSASTGIVWNAWAMAIEQSKDPDRKLEFGWFPDPNQPVLGAWLLAVPKNAQHSKQAMDFIRYAIGKEQLKLAARHGNPPPRISVFAELENADRYMPLLESLLRAQPRPRTPCWREVEKVLSKALSNWREDDSAQVVAELKSDLDQVRRREALPGCVTQ
jgi:multiple sugar transport system substrate-binding protein